MESYRRPNKKKKRKHHKKSHKPKIESVDVEPVATVVPVAIVNDERLVEDALAKTVKDRRFIRKGPCAECPFKKDCEPGTGNPDPLVYVGQAAGPFWLPCHMDPDYDTNRLGMEVLMHCGGAATFRANVGISDKFPTHLFLKLPPDGGERAFKSYEELVARHLETSLEEAAKILKEYPPEHLAVWQMAVAQGKGRVHLIPKKEGGG